MFGFWSTICTIFPPISYELQSCPEERYRSHNLSPLLLFSRHIICTNVYLKIAQTIKEQLSQERMLVFVYGWVPMCVYVCVCVCVCRRVRARKRTEAFYRDAFNPSRLRSNPPSFPFGNNWFYHFSICLLFLKYTFFLLLPPIIRVIFLWESRFWFLCLFKCNYYFCLLN